MCNDDILTYLLYCMNVEFVGRKNKQFEYFHVFLDGPWGIDRCGESHAYICETGLTGTEVYGDV